MLPDTPNTSKTTQYKQDPRFKTAHKEAWIGVVLAIFNFVWWFGFAYGLGGRPVEEYTYILGLPDWFFWSCVVGFILMSIITVVLAKFVLTDMPLDDDPAYHPEPPNFSDHRGQKGPTS
ncbi:YhdT family protein [Sporosarcina aquimarina]|uniref:YhdT family protein n=1 Tax=Sporosarcina aquimarina TaxID=114975 RepID=A0ABU4FZ54_9BACL|nr:YhdT family protein [Sporosarcina aquimarina]MDW0108682.1 YhdT family protein [Sporosarcina aquimarina]